VHLRDATSGMRLLPKSRSTALYPLPDGLDFTPAMSTRRSRKSKIIEVPIPYRAHWSLKLSVMQDGFRFLHDYLDSIDANPVRSWERSAWWRSV
jgi:hypothetical protein